MWNEAYLESKLLSADSMELVQILCQTAVDKVREARTWLATGDIKARSAAISKSMAILSELNASLNHEAGGEISRNLAELYTYLQQRLREANFKQTDEPLAESQRLLTTLLEAWQGVRREAEEKEPVPRMANPWGAGFAQEVAVPEARNWTL